MPRKYSLKYHDMRRHNDYRVRDYNVHHYPIVVRPGHVSNLIIVRMMEGNDYIFGTQNDDETYLDVKLAILDILTPTPLLRQLVFTDLEDFIDLDSDKGYKAIPDHKKLKKILQEDPVKINQDPIKIELLIIEPTWNDFQKPFIDMTSGEHVVIRTLDIDTYDKMEAVGWGLQNNSSILSLKIIRHSETTQLILPIITDVLLRDSPSILRLELDGHHKINVDDTTQLFDIIGQNNSLISIKMVNCSYRLYDFSMFLYQNTSLESVNLSMCNIDVQDGDITNFGEVLSSQNTLTLLMIRFGKIVDDDGLLTEELRDIFFSIGARDFGGKYNNINVEWENPNAI